MSESVSDIQLKVTEIVNDAQEQVEVLNRVSEDKQEKIASLGRFGFFKSSRCCGAKRDAKEAIELIIPKEQQESLSVSIEAKVESILESPREVDVSERRRSFSMKL